jgi:ferrous iron transport protein B
MEIKIALAGNPNCGKTTLFNALTGSNQYVGNWPGVTVEKKEGQVRGKKDVTLVDLPGIYSLSPYTLEEVVARRFLLDEHPDAILNIVDGTNLERNLYLSTQLAELGIPMVIAINMMDVVAKKGDEIHIEKLSRELGCEVVEISALKSTGIEEAADAAIRAAREGKPKPMYVFSGRVEHTLAHIEEVTVHDYPENIQRWYAIKIFERDSEVLEKLALPKSTLAHVEGDIKGLEVDMDDDSEGIITNERYVYIENHLAFAWIWRDRLLPCAFIVPLSSRLHHSPRCNTILICRSLLNCQSSKHSLIVRILGIFREDIAGR